MTFGRKKKTFCIWSIKFYNSRAFSLSIFCYLIEIKRSQNSPIVQRSKWKCKFFSGFGKYNNAEICRFFSLDFFSPFLHILCSECHHVYPHMSFFCILTGTWCMWLSFSYVARMKIKKERKKPKWIQREHSMWHSSNNRWTHMFFWWGSIASAA